MYDPPAEIFPALRDVRAFWLVRPPAHTIYLSDYRRSQSKSKSISEVNTIFC
jgi:hypothetical protein